MKTKPLDLPARLSTLTTKTLDALEDSLSSPELIPFKDLSSLAVSLLDRSHSSLINQTPAGPLTDATRGAVLGALEGLSSLAGISFSPQGLKDKLVNVTPRTQTSKSKYRKEPEDDFDKLLK